MTTASDAAGIKVRVVGSESKGLVIRKLSKERKKGENKRGERAIGGYVCSFSCYS